MDGRLADGRHVIIQWDGARGVRLQGSRAPMGRQRFNLRFAAQAVAGPTSPSDGPWQNGGWSMQGANARWHGVDVAGDQAPCVSHPQHR